MSQFMPPDVRSSLQDLMIDYCYAVDARANVSDLLAVFTEDAVADFTAIGLPMMKGASEIRRFFESVFKDMSHHAHYISNFRPESYNEGVAAMTAYVIGLGRSHNGDSVDVKVRYRFECILQSSGWLCRHYTITPMMPLPASLDQIHGDRS